VDLKDDVTYIHHWGCVCYVLRYVGVLVTILDEEEEIRYSAVCFNIKFKFQSLPRLLMHKVLIILIIWIEDFIGWIIESGF